MSICVFLGPTLPVADARAVLDAEYLPPAAVGDVYRAARKRPDAIAIIDGYFSRTPAIWHKEILWAMAEGVHVLGSSSMGALRAAELADFGMVGVGKVFEAYHAGTLIDDDEVAIAHSSAEDGYRALSDAMVNVRATLQHAERSGVLTPSACSLLEQLAKSQFYAERSLRQLAKLALERGLLEATQAREFDRFLVKHSVDQKRLDALALLESLNRERSMFRNPKRVHYVFEHTHTWEELLRDIGAIDADDANVQSDSDDQADDSQQLLELDMLDQLRLDGRFWSVRRAALGRVLALEEVTRVGRRVGVTELRRTSDDFRRQRGLLRPEALRAWMARNDLDVWGFEQLLRDEASIAWLDQGLAQASERLLLDHLRFSGEYERLRDRTARWSEPRLEALGNAREPQAPPGTTDAEIWTWYFRLREQGVPENLQSYATSLGFADAVALRTAVLKQFLVSREEAKNGSS